MLNRFKEYLYELLLKYYRNKADYCFRKLEEYEPEYNDYWGVKTAKYTYKEFSMFAKLIELEGVDH